MTQSAVLSHLPTVPCHHCQGSVYIPNVVCKSDWKISFRLHGMFCASIKLGSSSSISISINRPQREFSKVAMTTSSLSRSKSYDGLFIWQKYKDVRLEIKQPWLVNGGPLFSSAASQMCLMLKTNMHFVLVIYEYWHTNVYVLDTTKEKETTVLFWSFSLFSQLFCIHKLQSSDLPGLSL